MVLGYAKPLETNKVSKENGIWDGMKGAWICQARMNQIPASARPGRRRENPNSRGSTMVRGHWVVPGTSMTRSAYVGPDPEEETQRK